MVKDAILAQAGDALIIPIWEQSMLKTVIEVACASDLDLALRRALKLFIHQARANRGSMFLFDPDTKTLEPRVWEGELWDTSFRPPLFHLGEGIAGHVAKTRQPYYCRDVSKSTLYKKSLSSRPTEGSILCVPIVSHRREDELLGVVSIDAPEPNWFDEGLCPLLVELAHVVATAVEQAILFHRHTLLMEASEASLRERNFLLESGHAIATRVGDLDAMLLCVCQQAVQCVNGDAIADVYLYDASKQPWDKQFSHRQAWGERLVGPPPKHPRPKNEKGMGAKVLAGGTRVLSTGLDDIHPWKLTDGARVAVCLPIRYQMEVVGLLYVYLREERPFTDGELHLLEDLAATIGIAIEAARQMAARQQALAASQTVQALASMLIGVWQIPTILDLTLEWAIKATGAVQGWVKLQRRVTPNPTLRVLLDHGALHDAASTPPTDEETRRRLHHVFDGGDLGGYVMKTGEPLLISDLQTWLAEEPHSGIRMKKADLAARLAVPIHLGSQAVGALCLAHPDAGAFGPEDEHLVVGLANQAGLAIQRSLMEHLEMLVSPALGLQHHLKLLVDIARLFTHADHAVFRLVDRQRQELVLRVHRGSAKVPQRLKIDPNDSIVGWVAHHKQARLIRDIEQDELQSVYRPIAPVRNRSVLAVPLLAGGEFKRINGRLCFQGGDLRGVLDVEAPEPNVFLPEHEPMLLSLAARAGDAIRRADLLLAMQKVSAAAAKGDPEILFNVVVQQAGKLLDCPVVTLWDFDATYSNTLTLRAAVNYPGLADKALETLPISSFLGRVIRTGRTVYTASVVAEQDYQRKELAQELGWRSALVVPLKAQHKAVGVLCVYSQHQERAFSPWEIDLLLALGQHAASSLYVQQRLYDAAHDENAWVAVSILMGLNLSTNDLIHRVNNRIGLVRRALEKLSDVRPSPSDELVVSIYSRLDEINDSLEEVRRQFVRPQLPTPRPKSLNGMLIQAALMAGLSDMDIHLKMPDQDINVRANGLLPIAFLNLFSNAMEAMNGKGEIVVTTRCHDSRVDVLIRDTGPGIEPTRRTSIFRLHPPKGPEHGEHLGMGLWLAKQIVRFSDGELKLEPPGQPGAVFCMTLAKA